MNRSLRARSRVLFALCAAAVVTLSCLPYTYKQRLHTRGLLHYVAHVLVFGLLAYLARRAGKTPLQTGIYLTLIAAGAVSIEYMQHIATQGPIEWSDIAADLGGSALVTLASLLTGSA